MEIIDNVLSSLAFKSLKSHFNSLNCRWFFLQSATVFEGFFDESKEDPAFGLDVFYDEKIIDEHLFLQSLHILGNCCDKTNITVEKIINSRCWLTLPMKNISSAIPHVDLHYPHHVCLYYIDSCDKKDDLAKTTFFDKEGNVLLRHTPVENQAVIFDGSIMHQSGFPSKGVRRVLNMDFLPRLNGRS
jgi:hypothetical protein